MAHFSCKNDKENMIHAVSQYHSEDALTIISTMQPL